MGVNEWHGEREEIPPHTHTATHNDKRMIERERESEGYYTLHDPIIPQ